MDTATHMALAVDSPGGFSLVEALPDDALARVLSSLGVRWLGPVAQVSRRAFTHSRDPALLRKVLHQVLTAHRWRVREDQLLELPLTDVLVLLQQPDTTPLKRLETTPHRLPKNISISEDGSWLYTLASGSAATGACAPARHCRARRTTRSDR